MANKMLNHMARNDLATYIKGEDDVEIYEIGEVWVSVNAETDTFNQKVHAIGMNKKSEDGEYLPFQKREGWHFTSLKKILFHKRYAAAGEGGMFVVDFQYIYKRFKGTILEHRRINVLRCIVYKPDGDEVFNTDFDRWEVIERFLS